MSLETNLQNLTTRIATEVKALRTLINGNVADLAALNTTAKGNIVAALNEVQSLVAASSGIDDATTGTASTWSSQQTANKIAAAISALTDGAPTALDTLNELAAALGDDANFAASVTAGLGNRVRYDAAQTLTAGEQAQACANIGVGNPAANFVTTFEAGL